MEAVTQFAAATAATRHAATMMNPERPAWRGVQCRINRQRCRLLWRCRQLLMRQVDGSRG